MRKRIIVLGMCVVMAFSMTACKKKDNKETTTESSQESSLPDGLNEKDDVKEGEGEVVNLADYKKLTVGASKVTISDNSLDSSINSVLDGYPVKNGVVKDTDVVNIDFVGKINGKEFEGGTAQGQTLDIAHSTYIKGFAEGLVGKKIGDKVDLNLKFPEDYGKEELNGKDVVFTVTINSVRPELTDDFVAKNLKDDYNVSTVSEMKEYVKDQMVLSAKFSAVWKDYISECVVNASQEEVDRLVKAGVEYYEQYVKTNTEMELKEYIESQSSSYEEFEKTLKDEAVVSVKEQMIIEAIADAEKLAVTDEEYKKEAQYYVDNYGYESIEEMEEEGKVKKEEIMSNALYYKVAEWICRQVEVVDDSTEESTSAAESASKSE